MYTHKRYIIIAYALVMMGTNGAQAQTVTASAQSTKPAVCSVVGEHSAGEKSADASAIQAFLVSRGYALAQSGEFDTATVAALKQFQTLYTADTITMQGLSAASGVWDIYTAMKARELVCGAVVVPVQQVVQNTSPQAAAPQVSGTQVVTPVTNTLVPTPISAGVMPQTTQPGAAIPERSAFTPDSGTQSTSQPAQQVAAAAVPLSSPEPLVCFALEIEPGTKHSDDVKSIQRWLIAQGYTKVEATGIYGTYTKRAIAHFQTEHAADILVPAHLKKATGVWGERTAKKASSLGLCAYDTDVDPATAQSSGTQTGDGGVISNEVIPERSAFAGTTTPTAPTPPTPSQPAAPSLSTSGASSPALTAPSTTTEAITTGGTVVPIHSTVDPAAVAAEAAKLEEIYPGVCLPKTIGPIGTADAKTNVLAEVQVLQRFLISRGYTKVEATGYYGPMTQRAVAHFQEENARDILEPAGLAKATGTWGLRTAIRASELGLCGYK